MMGKFQHPKVDAKEVNGRFDPETLRMVFLPDVPPDVQNAWFLVRHPFMSPKAHGQIFAGPFYLQPLFLDFHTCHFV